MTKQTILNNNYFFKSCIQLYKYYKMYKHIWTLILFIKYDWKKYIYVYLYIIYNLIVDYLFYFV